MQQWPSISKYLKDTGRIFEKGSRVLQGGSLFLTTLWNSPEQLAAALRWLTIVGILSTGAFAIAAYFVTDRIGALQAAQILDQGDAIREQKQLIESQSQIVSQQDAQITHLNGDLRSVREQATELAMRAQNSERGVSDFYEFNGAHRQTSGGSTKVTVGREMDVFQKIVKLQSDKDWNELKVLCEDQIAKTPTWLTPYLFSGIANANLGTVAEAKERLEFVVTKAGNDSSYSDASRILAQIKPSTQH